MSKCSHCETTGVVGVIFDRCRIAQLEKELARHVYVVGKFETWYSTEECPYTQHNYCPQGLPSKKDEENKPLAEEDRFPFSPEYDCDESMQGWCWAKYYAKMFDELPEPPASKAETEANNE